MDGMKRQLEAWVRQVIELRGRIKLEGQVDELVWKIGLLPLPGGTLFEILGYTEQEVACQEKAGYNRGPIFCYAGMESLFWCLMIRSPRRRI